MLRHSLSLRALHMVLKITRQPQRHLTTAEPPFAVMPFKLVKVLAGADGLQRKSIELLMHGVVTCRTRLVARCVDLNEDIGNRVPGARRTVCMNL